MQLYEMSPTAGAPSKWFGTKGDAHESAKAQGARGDVRICLWDVPVDKAGVLALANGKSPRENAELLAGWGLTVRGGLQEIELAKLRADIDDGTDIVRVGPFYWSHPESESSGKVDTIEELNAVLEGDPNAQEITEGQYNALQLQEL